MADAASRRGSPVGLYVARLDLAQPHLAGVSAKIRAQVASLRCLPSSISVLFPSGGAIHRDGETIKKYGDGGIWRRLTYYAFFYFFAASHAARLDYVYIRYQGASPALLWMLRKVRRRNASAAVFIEIPTYPYQAAAITLRAKLMLLIDTLWRDAVFRRADRVVTFSRDPTIFGVPTIQTDNGVDVGEFTLLPPPRHGDTLRLVGVANVSYWHGYDRVIIGLGRYYAAGGTRDVHFDIVGTGFDLQALKDLTLREGLGHRVHFHGVRRGDELTKILERCHVGVSCIALHRKRSDTSDLKSREYCARGLPFVIGYADRDFPAELRFVFQAPADDSPLDIGKVVDFHAGLLAAHPEYQRDMRDYAVNRLAWQVKMEPVIAALQQFLPSGGDNP
jgi:hypothetical protein